MSATPGAAVPPDIQALAEEHPEYVEDLSRNRPWNFAINLIDIGTYSIATSALSETTVIPYFISQMTSSAFIIGLLPAFSWVGLYLPQIFGAYLVHSNPRRKPYIVGLAWLERIIIAVLLLVSLGIGRLSPALTLGTFLTTYFAFWIVTGFLIPSYSDFYAKHIPTDRGTFYGVQTLVSGGAGLLAAVIVRWRLASADFPQDLQSVLAIALLAAVPALIAIHNMREVSFPKPPAHRSLREYLGDIPDLLRANPAFVRFLVALSIASLGKMTVPFVAVYAVQHFALDGSVVAVYGGILMVAQSLSALLWGYLGDRIGYRWIWLAYAVLIVSQATIAWRAPSPAWFYFVFVLIGAALGVELTARPNTVYSLSPAEETPRFVGLANTFIAPWLAIGPLVAGALISAFSYPLALGVGALVAILGVPAMFMWVVNEEELRI